MPTERATHPWYNRPLPLGSIGGVPVSLSTSWFFVAVVLAIAVAVVVQDWLPGTSTPVAILMGLLQTLALMFSVLIHEVAHALVAKALGWKTTGIEVTLWGGHTSFTTTNPKASQSFLVSIVGPLTNLALAALIYSPAWFGVDLPEGPLRFFILMTVVANLAIGVFNLLPGLPLDGGRVVESIVWGLAGRQPIGTIIAGLLGGILALAGGVGVIVFLLRAEQRVTFVTLLMLLFMIVPLLDGAIKSVRIGRLRLRIEGMQAGHLVSPVVRLAPHASVADAVEAGVFEDTVVVVLSPDGSRLLRVRPEPLRRMVPAVYAGTPVMHVAVDAMDAHVVSAEADGDILARAALDSETGTVLVVDSRQRCIGAVRRESVVKALEGR